MAWKRHVGQAKRGLVVVVLALAVLVACGTPRPGPTWSDPAAVDAALRPTSSDRP